MGNFAIHVDTRDELKQKRFFPVGAQEHIKHNYDKSMWYYMQSYYESERGLDCCSDTVIGMHYIDPKQFYFLEYLIYRASAFGVYKNVTEVLPRKLELQEILNASDVQSNAEWYENHEMIHYLTDSEKFRKK